MLQFAPLVKSRAYEGRHKRVTFLFALRYSLGKGEEYFCQKQVLQTAYHIVYTGIHEWA